MKRTKLITVVLMVLAILVLFGTCKKKEEAPKKQIALLVKSLSNPFFISMKEGAEAEGKVQGYEILTQAPERESDTERQMQIMENMISNKVGAILLIPTGSIELVPAVKLANNQKIPVLVVDSKLDDKAMAADGARVETVIASDNYTGGKMAADLMIKLLNGKGKVAVIEGVAGHETAISRASGFADQIKAASPGIQIVASQPADWEREKGFNVFQNILTANPDIDGVFACNDQMALGAVEAVIQAGFNGRVKIIGFDAVDEAVQAVKDGTMAGTVAQNPTLMGKIAVESAVKLLKGEKIDTNIPVGIVVVTKDTL